MVIMDGEFFEGIMGARHQLLSSDDAPESRTQRDLES